MSELNRLQKRAKVLPDYSGHGIGILDVCLAVRISANGSADPMAHELMVRHLRFLRVCLETWEHPVSAIGARFDAAVKELVYATLEEAVMTCNHDPRFGGVFGTRNGCLACELEATRTALTATEEARCLARQAAREAQVGD